MEKLRLELEGLAVQSFDPVAADGGTRGTVKGRDYTWDDCPSAVWINCPSIQAAVDCPQSYYGTCQSCGSTCAGNCTVTCPTNTPECYEEW